MNVIMIVADTVVTDYLGVHGGHVHTPNLDRLAAESVDFLSAHAASFPTVPARADYLTGQYALTDIGWGPLPETSGRSRSTWPRRGSVAAAWWTHRSTR